MATAANPFDIKAGSAGTTTTGGTLTPGTSTTAAQFDPVQRQVDAAKETTSGQLQGIIAEDSPLMQQARAQAKQGMAARGLLNSSMAQGAGVAAMLEKATPIATADATTYANQAITNQQAANTGGQFNVGQQNTFGLQKGAQTFATGEREAGQTFATGEREAGQTFSAGQQTAMLKSQQDFASAQSDLDRAQQVALTDRTIEAQSALQTAQQNFQTAQAALDRTQQETLQKDQQAAALEQIGFKAKVDLQNIPTAFAANITNTTMNGVNAIMADGNMTADAKKGAIDNLIKYANAQVDWANKFYSAAIPPITKPA